MCCEKQILLSPPCGGFGFGADFGHESFEFLLFSSKASSAARGGIRGWPWLGSVVLENGPASPRTPGRGVIRASAASDFSERGFKRLLSHRLKKGVCFTADNTDHAENADEDGLCGVAQGFHSGRRRLFNFPIEGDGFFLAAAELLLLRVFRVIRGKFHRRRPA